MIILFQGVCVVALQSTFTFYQTKVDWRSSSTYDDDDEGEIQLNSMIITIMEKMRIHVFIFQLSIDRDRSLSFVRLSGSENNLAKQQHKLPSNQPSNLPIVKATGRKNSNENFESSSHTHTERKREQQKEKTVHSEQQTKIKTSNFENTNSTHTHRNWLSSSSFSICQEKLLLFSTNQKWIEKLKGGQVIPAEWPNVSIEEMDLFWLARVDTFFGQQQQQQQTRT